MPSQVTFPAVFMRAIWVFVPPPSTPRNNWWFSRLRPFFEEMRAIGEKNLYKNSTLFLDKLDI